MINFDIVNKNLDELGNKVSLLSNDRDMWKSKYQNYPPSLICIDRLSGAIASQPWINLCGSIKFSFMGFAKSNENRGKAIYNMTDTLFGQSTGGSTPSYLGTTSIAKTWANEIDTVVYSITGKHLQPYTRTYDGRTVDEKVFLPLECEVWGDIRKSKDKSILSRYPQWDGFKVPHSQKKLCIDNRNDYSKVTHWLNANAAVDKAFCSVDGWGSASSIYGGTYSLCFCI